MIVMSWQASSRGKKAQTQTQSCRRRRHSVMTWTSPVPDMTICTRATHCLVHCSLPPSLGILRYKFPLPSILVFSSFISSNSISSHFNPNHPNHRESKKKKRTRQQAWCSGSIGQPFSSHGVSASLALGIGLFFLSVTLLLHTYISHALYIFVSSDGEQKKEK